jgi:Ca2+-binding EF-hand superfamily protein
MKISLSEATEKIMGELDDDSSGKVSFYEFSKVMNRLADFKLKFRFSRI